MTANTIKIIQITDTHIIDDGAPSFNDFDTTASLHQVVEKIREDEHDADCVLLTGDLVHDATKSSYQKLADLLSSLTTPLLSLPGNHDLPELMDYVMGANGYDTGKIFKMEPWLIILLDSCVIGEHSGDLADSELDFLRSTLESNRTSYCLIALHHHPVSVHSSWMDSMILKNAEDFLNIIDEFEHVRGIIWGHIHQEFKTMRNKVCLLGSPSTCLQFKPKSDIFAVDKKPPAYRKLELLEDGTLKTEVIYLLI
ncbi:MAG: 3',5'-cyclic-AMP phosphodiesterase [Proteobacteria bacterium]|nr:3',5'-cyclic-AMP phosphodiesterase [Pseudomonadota bacterium]NOG59467.1 3',5'-cyclic-AMP phosphodiesterase [Pseudomonadota bacterium]